jgi:hypothetical protein
MKRTRSVGNSGSFLLTKIPTYIAVTVEPGTVEVKFKFAFDVPHLKIYPKPGATRKIFKFYSNRS